MAEVIYIFQPAISKYESTRQKLVDAFLSYRAGKPYYSPELIEYLASETMDSFISLPIESQPVFKGSLISLLNEIDKSLEKEVS